MSIVYSNPVAANLVCHLRYEEMKTVSVPKLCINMMSAGITNGSFDVCMEWLLAKNIFSFSSLLTI